MCSRSIAWGTDGTHHMELETPFKYVSCTHDNRMDAQVK